MPRPRKRTSAKVVLSVDVYDSQQAMEEHLALFKMLKWPGHRGHRVLNVTNIGEVKTEHEPRHDRNQKCRRRLVWPEDYF